MIMVEAFARTAHAPKACGIVESFAPGRTELAGNHTDHQGGRVIAAALGRGVTMRMQARDDDLVVLESVGYQVVSVSASDLEARDEEKGTTTALVRGVIAGLVKARPGQMRGFSAQVSSSLPAGGGLSSSAAFELSLAGGLNLLFFGESLDAVELARIAQAAERDFFGKPCGLMDQLSCALGGVQLMDFYEPDSPQSTPFAVDFEAAGYAVCLIDTHSDHSALSAEYARVSGDMVAVANLFGKAVLSQVPRERFFESLSYVRSELSDRAALRALHYYHEMDLVNERARALRAGDWRAFLEATRRSGASSAQYLQNVAPFGAPAQPAMVALALADVALEGAGACRIHGGGFGGNIQAYVPLERLDTFSSFMEAQFGEGSCRVCSFSPKGVYAQWV